MNEHIMKNIEAAVFNSEWITRDYPFGEFDPNAYGDNDCVRIEEDRYITYHPKRVDDVAYSWRGVCLSVIDGIFINSDECNCDRLPYFELYFDVIPYGVWDVRTENQKKAFLSVVRTALAL